MYHALRWWFKVVQRLREAGFMADIDDDRGATLNKKIRSAQLAQYNYIFGKDQFYLLLKCNQYTFAYPYFLHSRFLTLYLEMFLILNCCRFISRWRTFKGCECFVTCKIKVRFLFISRSGGRERTWKRDRERADEGRKTARTESAGGCDEVTRWTQRHTHQSGGLLDTWESTHGVRSRRDSQHPDTGYRFHKQNRSSDMWWTVDSSWTWSAAATRFLLLFYL